MCPFPRLHFLTTTLAPLINSRDLEYENLEVGDLVKEMFDSKNSFCEADISKGKFMTAACVFRGDVSTSEIDKNLNNLKNRNSSKFSEWIPDSFLAT